MSCSRFENILFLNIYIFSPEKKFFYEIKRVLFRGQIIGNDFVTFSRIVLEMRINYTNRQINSRIRIQSN